jgi:hypothetical protein
LLIIHNLILDLNNQINFINLVKSNSKIFNLDDTALNKILVDNKIKKYSDSFDYLLNMNFRQLSYANLNKLENKIKELKKDKKELENSNGKTLWLNNLKALLY